MWTNSDMRMSLLLLSRSLSLDRAAAAGDTAAGVWSCGGGGGGGRSMMGQKLLRGGGRWAGSSESGGEMLPLAGKGKKLAGLTPRGRSKSGRKDETWWGGADFRRWISHSRCFSPLRKNSFANSHRSGTIFLKP